MVPSNLEGFGTSIVLDGVLTGMGPAGGKYRGAFMLTILFQSKLNYYITATIVKALLYRILCESCAVVRGNNLHIPKLKTTSRIFY